MKEYIIMSMDVGSTASGRVCVEDAELFFSFVHIRQDWMAAPPSSAKTRQVSAKCLGTLLNTHPQLVYTVFRLSACRDMTAREGQLD
jgi:hypothetical protein